MKNFALLSGICDGANEAVIVAFTVSERWPWHEVTFIQNLLALLSCSTTQHRTLATVGNGNLYNGSEQHGAWKLL